MRHASFAATALLASILATSPPPASGAIITIHNDDGPGVGFNDTTAVAPVGGNLGTTLGAQRLIALQVAADTWASTLDSDVEIFVSGVWDSLPCTGSSARLAQAGPTNLFIDFAGAPQADTWYPAALANKHAGVDLAPGSDDITATFNIDIDTGCSSSFVYYYGLDGNPPVGPPLGIDFIAVAIHELGHGLGFATYVDLPTGAKLLGSDDTYMRNLEDHSTGALWPTMTNAERVTSAKDTGDLHWVGASVVANSGGLTDGRHASGHVEMYAPSPLGGSNVSHWSSDLSPDEVLEPAYTGPQHTPGLAVDLMVDIGWTLVVCGDGVVATGEECDDNNTTPGDGCSASCHVEPCRSCTGEPSVCTTLGDGSSCTDGNACTQTDTCTSGACIGSNPVTCTPLDQCHLAGTCNPGTGTCSNPNETDGTPCADGDACTSPDVCTAGVCAGPPTCIDHFLCYRAKTTKGTPKFVVVPGVTLVDVFESLTVDARKPKHLCTPADKNGEGIVDPSTHVTSYQVKAVSGSPKHVPQVDLHVTNQLGDIHLNTVKPDLLLVPSAKNLAVDPPAPNPLSHEVDHYKCYKVKVTPGMPKFVKGQTVTVADQFIAPKVMSLLKPALLCAPVVKNGEPIKHGTVHQLCYKVKPATAAAKQPGLHVSNQFGLGARFDTGKEDMLCIPSQVGP